MRVFLHLHECGTTVIDEEGVVVTDVDAARDAAIVGARAIMSAEVLAGRLCLSCHIAVEDERGRTLFLVPFRDAIILTGVRGTGPLAL